MIGEKFMNLVVNNILGIDSHNEISMSIILNELNCELEDIMKLEFIKQLLNILDIRQSILSSIADKKRKLWGNI